MKGHAGRRWGWLSEEGKPQGPARAAGQLAGGRRSAWAGASPRSWGVQSRGGTEMSFQRKAGLALAWVGTA